MNEQGEWVMADAFCIEHVLLNQPLILLVSFFNFGRTHCALAVQMYQEISDSKCRRVVIHIHMLGTCSCHGTSVKKCTNVHIVSYKTKNVKELKNTNCGFNSKPKKCDSYFVNNCSALVLTAEDHWIGHCWVLVWSCFMLFQPTESTAEKYHRCPLWLTTKLTLTFVSNLSHTMEVSWDRMQLFINAEMYT